MSMSMSMPMPMSKPATPRPSALPLDAREAFEADGYWVSPPLLDADRVAGLRRAHDRIWARDFDTAAFPQHEMPEDGYPPHGLRQLVNGWWLNDAVRDVVLDPEIGAIAAGLLGVDRVRLWHDQVILKPPAGENAAGDTGGNVGWHQDDGFWRALDTTNTCTVWIALQDTDFSNGGMRTIAGSHRWGLIDGSDTFFDTDLDGLKERFSAHGAWRDEPCVIQAGGASFHHGLTFHGSGPNLSDAPRLSVVAHLMPDGTGYSGVACHPSLQLLGPRPRRGQRFDNAHFPLLGG